MGVKGLSTYINENVNSSLQWHKLHDCTVIIDGSNLYFWLFRSGRGFNSAFGGDYDKFAAHTENFFKILNDCRIKAYVVMDGGHPLHDRKTNTCLARISDQLKVGLIVNPGNHNRCKMPPALGRHVFASVLKRIGVPVIQADLEADEEIAFIAKEMNWTVISNDSDFFLFNISFVLLNSLNMDSVLLDKSGEKPVRFLPCYMFNVEIFTKETRVPGHLMPLMGTILGNDYVSPLEMSSFYSTLPEVKAKSLGNRQYTIKKVLYWLRGQKKAPEVILEKVISHLRSGKRIKIGQALRQTLSGYSPSSSNILECFIPHTCPSNSNVAGNKSGCDPCSVQMIFSKMKDRVGQWQLKKIPSILNCSCDHPVSSVLTTPEGSELPQWLVRAYRNHRLDRELADILTRNYFISSPLIEVRKEKSAYEIALPLVSKICMFLFCHSSSIALCTEIEDGVCLASGDEGSLPSSEESLPSSKESLPSRYDTALEQRTDGDVGSDDLVCKDIIASSLEVHMENSTNLAAYNAELNYCASDDNDENDADLIDGELNGSDPNDDDDAEDIRVSKMDIISDNDEGLGSIPATAGVLPEGDAIPCLLLEEECDPDVQEVEELKKQIAQHSSDGIGWYIRHFSALNKRLVKPTSDTVPVPSVNDVSSMTQCERRDLFYRLVEVAPLENHGLPSDLELILVIVIYWYKRSQVLVSPTHILTINMCIMMFFFIDLRVGRLRVSKNYKSKIEYLNKDYSRELNEPCEILQLVNNLTYGECVNASYNLRKYHYMSVNINRRAFDKYIVHSFSEFQACFYFIKLINELLFRPLHSVDIDNIWSGTFAYNIFSTFSGRKNVSTFVVEMLGQGTVLWELYTCIYNIFVEQLLLSPLCKPNISKKISAKKKKKNCSTDMNESGKSVGADLDKGHLHEEDEESLLCSNRFFQLTLSENS